jgi:hypothetical protein
VIRAPGSVAAQSILRFNVFQPDPAPGTQAVSCLLNTARKSGIMFKTIFEQADEHLADAKPILRLAQASKPFDPTAARLFGLVP